MIKAAFKNAATRLAGFDTHVLGISMGSQTHRGQALEAIVDLLNGRDAKKVIINVADTLRRHTIMAQGQYEDEPKEAHQAAARMGDEWIHYNQAILKKLKMPWKIMRWDRFLNDRRFPDYYRKFETAYRVSTALKEALHSDILAFYQRVHGKSYSPTSKEFIHSERFFLEELAVLSIQFEDFPAAQLYPGKELRSFRVVRNNEVHDVPRGIQNAQFFRINVYEKPANQNAPNAQHG